MSTLEQNTEKLDGYLRRFKDNGILNRTDGGDRAGGGGIFQSVSPVDKSVVNGYGHDAGKRLTEHPKIKAIVANLV